MATRIALALAILELLSAVPLYGIYTMPVAFFNTEGYWRPLTVGLNVLGVFFLLLPILAVLGLLRGWRSSFLWMGLFPVAAWVFGAVPIPFAKQLFYTADVVFNSYLITAIDGLAIAITYILYRSILTRSNPTPHSDAREPMGSASESGARAGGRER